MQIMDCNGICFNWLGFFLTYAVVICTGICWDQWFPEAARCMTLMGAEILFYPTAIGSEPQDSGLDSFDHWRRVMQGHAGANLVSCVMCRFRFHVLICYIGDGLEITDVLV